MDKILFRCSRLSELMTSPRNKNELVSATTKDLCLDTFLQNEYGYYEDVMTPPMMKGLTLESKAMGFLSELDGKYRKPYKVKTSNDWIIGTPDIVLDDCVEDIKCSANLKTFLKAEMNENYMWQGIGYMWLMGRTTFKLRYVLLPDDEDMITEAKKKVWYKFGCDEENPDYQRMSKQIDHNNNIINSIPKEKRVKTFVKEYNPIRIEFLKEHIEKAREYYQTIKL